MTLVAETVCQTRDIALLLQPEAAAPARAAAITAAASATAAVVAAVAVSVAAADYSAPMHHRVTLRNNVKHG